MFGRGLNHSATPISAASTRVRALENPVCSVLMMVKKDVVMNLHLPTRRADQSIRTNNFKICLRTPDEMRAMRSRESHPCTSIGICHRDYPYALDGSRAYPCRKNRTLRLTLSSLAITERVMLGRAGWPFPSSSVMRCGGRWRDGVGCTAGDLDVTTCTFPPRLQEVERKVRTLFP